MTRPGAPPVSIVQQRPKAPRFLERLFAPELEGHALITNRSIWRQFPAIVTRPWSVENIVLIGNTAHFSVGSGTRMAMEDAVALRTALVTELAGHDGKPRAAVLRALQVYEVARRPRVESLQRAAQASLAWFEEAERYMDQPPLQFAFTLLTRSLRITHEDLRVRDPQLLAKVDEFVADTAARQTGTPRAAGRVPPPMFTPFRLRELLIPNRIVMSPMCQYVADDGTVGDWHLVHLGSRTVGGAGLVMAEMTDVSRRRAHLAVVGRTIFAASCRRVEAHRRVRPRAKRREDRRWRPSGSLWSTRIRDRCCSFLASTAAPRRCRGCAGRTRSSPRRACRCACATSRVPASRSTTTKAIRSRLPP